MTTTDGPLELLRTLEAEYPDTPVFARRALLTEINALRRRLVMPEVDDRLLPVGGPAAVVRVVCKSRPDHSEARALYEEFVRVGPALEAHRAYADRVAEALNSPSMTPVEPLATMGPGGGPLLCDVCGKPIPLEGGRYHKVPAHEAWASNPVKGWKSFVSGGLVIRLLPNGTIRIYHGYPGHENACCTAAAKAEEDADRAFRPRNTLETFRKVIAFVEDEFPHRSDRDRNRLANDVLNTIDDHARGFGVNKPEADRGM